MSTLSWLKRSCVVFLAVFAALTAVELLKHHPLPSALTFAALWALIAAGIFTATRVYYARRGIECAMCNDITK